MPDGPRQLSLAETVRQAVADLSARGYVSAEQIARWLALIRAAAERQIGDESRLDAETRRHLEALYAKLVERGDVLDFVPGVGRYTLAMVRPDLRAELDRRILAAANLTKLHRREAIEKTLARFQGWSTAIPPGGEGAIDKREVRAHICKSARDFKFEQRRVAIDQGHKLVANVADIVAVGNGAIAAEWHDRGEHDKHYEARPDHLARSGKIFAIRDNWAIRAGLMSKGAGYTDEIEMVGQLPYCSCTYRYLLSPRQLPDAMLTRKGQRWIAESGGRSERSAA